MRIYIAIAIVVLIILTACTPTPTGHVVDKKPIKIGIILSLTSTSADAGNYIRNGLELALEEINADNSVQNKYELIFEDSLYDPKTAVTAVNKLIHVNKINYIIGAYGSSQTLAIAPVAEKNKVILITPGSQSDKISKAGEYVFRTQINTAQEAKFISKYLLNRIGNKPLSVLTVNTAYGTSIIEGLKKEYEQKGGIIGVTQLVDPKETDLRGPLLKIKESGSEHVLIAVTRKMGGQIVKQAAELRINVEFFATSVIEGEELINIGGEHVDGLIYSYPYDTTSNEKTQKDFREKYMAKYNKPNEMLSANGYDALNVLVECIENVGDDTDKVKACLYNTKDYPGASGTFSFNENGDVEKDFIIKTVANGGFVNLR